MPSLYHALAVILLASAQIVEITGFTNKRENDSKDQHLNILILTLPARGHVNPLLILSRKLVSRGHNITFIVGTDDDSLLTPNQLHNLISGHNTQFLPFVSKVTSDIPNTELKNGMTSIKDRLVPYAEEMLQYSSEILSTKIFDVIIGDDFLMGPMLCINSHWNIPVIIAGVSMPMFISEEPVWPWPGMLQGQSSDDLTFSQRIISFVEMIFFKKLFNRFVLSPQFYALHKFCPSMTKEQLYDAPGVYLPHIVPTVIGFEYPRTFTPLTSYVGPFIPEDPAPLSQTPRLQDWLDNKTDKSVVYISMGSVFPLDKNTASLLVEGVMQTNYSLLWSLRKSNQWILEDLELDEERIYISEWTPQFSVLASKTIHSAILHGGFNGLSEALWNGVPIIGFPQMFEQSLTVGRLFHNQLGLRLDKETLTSAKVTKAIVSIDKGNYRSNIRKLRKMFELAGGLNRATELIEFYGREGYTHLIPAYAKYQWSWIHFYNLDVWLLFSTTLGLFIFFIFRTFKYCMKHFSNKVTKLKTA